MWWTLSFTIFVVLNNVGDLDNSIKTTVLNVTVSVHFFRHGPEAQSVFVTFASAFLVKVDYPASVF